MKIKDENITLIFRLLKYESCNCPKIFSTVSLHKNENNLYIFPHFKNLISHLVYTWIGGPSICKLNSRYHIFNLFLFSIFNTAQKMNKNRYVFYFYEVKQMNDDFKLY